MKKITRMLVLALALVAALSLGAGSTAEAAKKATVSKVKAVDKVTGKNTITLTKGKKATLKVTVSGKNLKAKDKKVSYKTSNKKVATVNSKGVIAAKKKTGSAKITVTSKTNKKKKATVKVKVVAGKVTKVTLNKKTLSLEEGKTSTLKATVKTSGKKPNKTIKWSSNKTSVATVSSKGKVTAKKAGTATITAKATDGTGKKATCKVTVTAKPAPTPDPEPTPAPEKTTVLTPKDASVWVTVVFKENSDLAAIQSDIDKAAIAAKLKDQDDIKITINGNEYTAVWDATKKHVTINGKTVDQSDAAKKSGNEVIVDLQVKADLVAGLVPLTPSYVEVVSIHSSTNEKTPELLLTSITSEKFTVMTFDEKGETVKKEYSYSVSGKSIVIKGDCKADFEKYEYIDAQVK